MVDDLKEAIREGRRQPDPIGTTAWGRVPEPIRRLASLHAAAASHLAPRIDAAAVQWATHLMLHQTQRRVEDVGPPGGGPGPTRVSDVATKTIGTFWQNGRLRGRGNSSRIRHSLFCLSEFFNGVI
jgi:hypothetical protein